MICAKKLTSFVEIDTFVWIFAALFLFFIPIQWLIAALTATAVHEAGHIITSIILGKEIRTIQISPTGIRILSAPMNRKEALACILAGPSASFLLILGIRVIPKLAICGFFQGLFNMLPIRGLDGHNLLCTWMEGKGAQRNTRPRKIPCKEEQERVQ